MPWRSALGAVLSAMDFRAQGSHSSQGKLDLKLFPITPLSPALERRNTRHYFWRLNTPDGLEVFASTAWWVGQIRTGFANADERVWQPRENRL